MAGEVYRLVAVDLDGTALDDAHKLTSSTIEALTELRANGVIVCIATGRSLASVQEYVRLLQWRDVPAVCYNGAFGFKVSFDAPFKLLFSAPLSIETTRLLLQLASDLNLVAQYYHGETGEVYCRHPGNDVQKTLINR